MSLRYLLTRLLTGIGVMWGVVTLVFLLLRVAPGDPARLILGPSATVEQVEAQRHQLGLDRPVVEQYGAWLSRVVRGDLGTSIATGRPVGAMLAEAWPATALLVSLSLLLSYILGILLALVQADASGTKVDTGLSIASVTLYAMPSYWLAVVLVLVFAYWWRVFPAFGAQGLDAEFLSPVGRLGDRLRHLALPLVTLTLIGIGGIARYVRGSLVDLQGSQFLTGGAGEGTVAARGAAAACAAERAHSGADPARDFRCRRSSRARCSWKRSSRGPAWGDCWCRRCRRGTTRWCWPRRRSARRWWCWGACSPTGWWCWPTRASGMPSHDVTGGRGSASPAWWCWH